jgi:hypothetical protein
MAVVKDSYTHIVTHDKKKLAITVNVYDEPVLRNEVNDYHTHVCVTHLGHRWGECFLPDPVDNPEETAKETIKILDKIKL